MAVVLLPGGSDMAGKPVNIILPLVGQFRFQLVQFRIGKKNIVVSAILTVWGYGYRWEE